MATRQNTAPAGSVVVGFDGSGPAVHALDVAVDEARRRAAALVVLVVAGSPGAWSDGVEDLYGDAPGALDRATKTSADGLRRATQRCPDLSVETVVCRSAASLVIRELAGRSQLLVLGGRGQSGQHCLAAGSTSAELVRAFGGPVLVAHPAGGQGSAAVVPEGAVVAGVDGREGSTAVLRAATEECRLSQRNLVAVHAYGGADVPPQHRSDVCWRLFDHAVTGLDGLAGPAGGARADRLVFSRGGPVDALTGWARAGDLLVVGAHARGSLRAADRDAVLRRVLDEAPCDVLVVPSALA